MDPLTASIANASTALSQQRLQSEMSIRLLDKALDAAGQNALALLASIPAPSTPGKGERVDVVA